MQVLLIAVCRRHFDHNSSKNRLRIWFHLRVMERASQKFDINVEGWEELRNRMELFGKLKFPIEQ